MKHLKITTALTLLLVSAASVLADRQQYTPPPEKGYVYVVIRYRGVAAERGINVSITWGRWQRQGSFGPSRLLLPGRKIPYGVVIRLRHTKADSETLTVETDGQIQNIRQGEPPSEWTSNDYDHQSW